MIRSFSGRSAFTLVELLVVIAIIAVLVGLLLPAIQNVRESGRRLQCTNNLKQMALGCVFHHDVKKGYPPGGASDSPPFGTKASGGGWGSSWAVYLLPYIEQQELFTNWKFDGNSGWQNLTNEFLQTGVIKTYLCPSSSLPLYCSTPPATVARMSNSYVAIAGTAVPFPGYTAANTADPGTGAKTANDGVLIPWGRIRAEGITDGTSHTVILSEYSDYIYDTAGSRYDWRTKNGFAIGFGSNGSSTATSDINTWNASGWGGQVNNLTTIRYAINLTRDPNNAYWKTPSNFDCPGKCCGNLPLNSAHTNGVNVAFADGSVTFMADTTSLQVLSSLAVRNDGQTGVSTDAAAATLNTLP